MPPSVEKPAAGIAESFVNLVWRTGLIAAYRVLHCYWFIFRPRSAGVYVAVWYLGRILIIRNSYRRWYNLPCGGKRPGEQENQAAVRELKEEVGIIATVEQLSYQGTFHSTREFRRDCSAMFELVLDAKPRLNIDHREVVWAQFIDPAYALTLDLADIPSQYLKTRPIDESGKAELRGGSDRPRNERGPLICG